MGIMQRAADLLGFAQRSGAEDAATPPAGIMPPRRSYELNAETALRISTVYRAIEVLVIGVSQLGIDQWRGDRRVTPSAIVAKPDVNRWRSAFIEETVAALALAGNAYWRIIRNSANEPISLTMLTPSEVAVTRTTSNELRYNWRGKTFTPGDRTQGDIIHLQKLRIAGRDTGLGPIESARTELAGALQARDYAATLFERGDVTTGVLSSDQKLNGTEAETYRRIWSGLDPETGEPLGRAPGVRVVGAGLKYDSLQINPADLQFLETQQFNTTQIARLFGTPASLMLAVVEGNSQSYSNVEQDWIAFTRFTLMTYLSEIEEALSSLLPHGNTVRFNVDALQRSDTKTRYEAHKIGLEAGFLTVPEVRSIEGLDPMPELATPTESEPAA